MPAASSPMASRASTRTPAISRASSPFDAALPAAPVAIFNFSSSASRRAFFNFAETFVSVEAGHGPYTPHAGSDRFVAGDFEDTDVAGRAHVRAAAEFS